MKITISQSVVFGLDFREYLKETERAKLDDRHQLKLIYNSEFRYRNECIKGPNFGTLLYALKVTRKATICRGKVCFDSKSQTRDQWHNSSRMRQPASSRNGTSSPSPSRSSPCPPAGTRSRRKLASLLMVKLTRDKTQFVSDKNGVFISSEHEGADRKICLCVEDDNKHVVRLCVRNAGTSVVHFTYYTLLNWLQDFTLEDEQKVTRAHPLALAPGDSYEIQVLFQTSLVGFYPATLAFEFKPDPLPSSVAFHIVRYIEVQRVTSLGKELAPVAPYRFSPISSLPHLESCPIVDGQPPERESVMRLIMEIKLKYYNIPKYMNQLIDSLKNPDYRMDPSTQGRKALLDSTLTMENYCERFELLLYLEELQMLNDIKRYNIPNKDREHATMSKDPGNKKLLVLQVPGVAENRPSVLTGDRILVCPIGDNREKYCGYVHAVNLDQVKLGFSSKLLDRFIDGMQFSVEFTVSRLPMRLQHRAAEMAKKHGMGGVLFPNGPPPLETDPKLPSLRLFDRKLEGNPEQYKAVQHIVAGSSKPAPYLVFGPPGTGKTVTVVEAIKQIEKTQKLCHILACAPSNSASDLLCKKILEHVEERKVYRMYASSWDAERIPNELRGCSNRIGNVYMYPSKEDLLNYTIIVTTLCTAGRLVTGGIPPGHFSHVFVDEAGHAVETECIIPLAGLVQPESGQVVLAGDPKQLGPILRSPLVQNYGMSMSLLERLMDTMPVYRKIIDLDDEGEEEDVSDDDSKQEAFDPRFVTKLLCNYRSHPAILKVPNDLFYHGELQVCADEALRNSFCMWEYLPKMGFPVIFHGVTGVDEREANSPSFFNVAEVEQLMEYVKRLLERQGRKGLYKISPKDIGIIAPYRKQVLKIRKGLRILEKNLQNPDLAKYLKVGSVEEFQGQERMVMLVSTVRSSPKYADHDQQFDLGFVKNEKRFNVAVTRAKALLIMVGNPIVLGTDPVWNSFIEHCKDNGGYTGVSYAEEEEDVVARLAALWTSIEPKGETEETGESLLQQQLDPEWRNEL
ncbi:putative helicase mov-10-B.2 [Gadus macrocephalus]|uniref:putative helicase mov-10-B.2 n=1 Tax=Gadus macrocephalus TaxID=80720 RepID=UPI0028CB6B10|nr:putative helicase mov-10-B.2 [Gadus macrocephalus]